MVFSSSLFLLLFLPVFLLTYYLVSKPLKNSVILIFSIIFYSWGAPKFIFVILGTTFLDFHLVRWMSNTKKQLHRRLMLTLSVSINVGLLFYFKYSNFFIENINSLLSLVGIQSMHWTKLVLPIGISFYTFETVTYVVDVYRRVHKPLDNFWDYQVYIILFPKLIAGPIVRFHEIADQIEDREKQETIDNRLLGLLRFSIGLAKKVLIANVMGAEADQIFALDKSLLNTPLAWIGAIAYTFQIYYDFSGYSDMAIGLGRMMGFRFPENFNNPYVSQSITEFWRRWHMTLGNFMKNYLYIPLGGNRVNTKRRFYFNLWIVFVFSGLWHGAAWTFILWGIYHGCLLVFERVLLLRFYSKIGKYPSVLITFFLTIIGWVIFRAETLDQSFYFIHEMFAFNFTKHNYYIDSEFITILCIAILFAFITLSEFGLRWQERIFFKKEYSLKGYLVISAILIFLFTISIGSITASGFNPFIYFRF